MLDLSKPVQCANGSQARILCSDRDSLTFPIVALFGSLSSVGLYSRDGTNGPAGREYDLVNSTVKRWKWAVAFDTGRKDEFVTTSHYTEDEVKLRYHVGKYIILGRILETEQVEK